MSVLLGVILLIVACVIISFFGESIFAGIGITIGVLFVLLGIGLLVGGFVLAIFAIVANSWMGFFGALVVAGFGFGILYVCFGGNY